MIIIIIWINTKTDLECVASMTLQEHELQNTGMELESTQNLKKGLALLLRRYLQEESQYLAKKIVAQIERLLAHSDCIGFQHNRCAYYRLLIYWRVKAL